MSELDHDSGAMLVAFVRQLLHPADYFILEEMQIAKGRGRVSRDDGGAGGHGEGDTVLGPFDMV